MSNHAEEHESHQDEHVEREQSSGASGSAGSFDSRHSEFAPGSGQEGAGRDAKTHQAVHGDGIAVDEPDEPHSGGFDAEQPAGVSEELQSEALEEHGEAKRDHFGEIHSDRTERTERTEEH